MRPILAASMDTADIHKQNLKCVGRHPGFGYKKNDPGQ
jgi:hypothetical protein